MELRDILGRIDHTDLKAATTLSNIYRLCDQADKYGFAAVCIPPAFVGKAFEYAAGKVKICSVVGFPLGYSTTGNKVLETRELIAAGATEIDMVINIGKLKAREYSAVRTEIAKIREAAKNSILKVIIETCLLTEEEKIKMCEIVTAEGADYIKTSTGFSSGGAELSDINLFRQHLGNNVKIKAAGGIRTSEQVIDFIRAGADRIGMSSAISAFGLG